MTRIVTSSAVIATGAVPELVEYHEDIEPAAIRADCGFEIGGTGEPAPPMPAEALEYLDRVVDPSGVRELEVPGRRGEVLARLATR